MQQSDISPDEQRLPLKSMGNLTNSEEDDEDEDLVYHHTDTLDNYQQRIISEAAYTQSTLMENQETVQEDNDEYLEDDDEMAQE